MKTYTETQVRKALKEWQVDCEEGVIETLRASSAANAGVYTILTNTGLKGFPNAIIGPTRDIKDDLIRIKNSLGGVQYVSNVITLLPEKKEYGPGWKFSDQVMGAVKEILEDKTFREVDASRPEGGPSPTANEHGNYELEGYVFYPVNCPEGKVFYVVGVQDNDSEELYLESVVPLSKKGIVECQQKGWMVMSKKALDLVRSPKYKPRLVELYEQRT